MIQGATQVKPLDGIPLIATESKGSILSQELLLKRFLAVSVVLHIVVVFVSGLRLFSVPPPITDEWTMDADLVTDLSMPVPTTSALPQAQKAEEAKVQADLLPQLTKTVSIKEATKEEEAVAEAPQEKKDDVKDAKVAEKTQVLPENQVKSTAKDAPELEEKELLKRRAIELLRLQNQTAKKNEAPDANAIARIGQELAKKDSSDKVAAAGGSLAGKTQAKRYVQILQKAVRQHYVLPEAYNLKGAELVVVIGVTVTVAGDISNLEVKQPSKDPAFDTLTLDAVRAAAPLPKPPADLAGIPIDFRFTP